MIWYNAYDRVDCREVILYDEWDIPDKSQIVNFNTCTIEDIGKFVMFTDGSNVYTKIISMSPRMIVTECGVYRRADIVHCLAPKRYVLNYYTVDLDEVHPAVRPYTAKEKKIANYVIQGKRGKYSISPRVKMLTLEMLKDRSKDRGMSETEIIDKIIDNANNDRSIHWKWSMTLLMHAHGMDPNDYIFSHMKKVEAPEKQRITILDDKRTLTETKIPSIRSIENMIQKSSGKIEEAVIK